MEFYPKKENYSSKQCLGYGSGLDLDSNRTVDPDPDPDPGSKNDP
jgi:hypothetical protein